MKGRQEAREVLTSSADLQRQRMAILVVPFRYKNKYNRLYVESALVLPIFRTTTFVVVKM